MTDTFEFSTRPGSAALSAVTIVGLGALAALLYSIIPGYVLAFMVPALAICLWQITRVPTYGIRMTRASWFILGGYEDLEIPTSQIAYLRLVGRGAVTRMGVMLDDGTEVQLPIDCLPDPLEMIREAPNRGIPVRETA